MMTWHKVSRSFNGVSWDEPIKIRAVILRLFLRIGIWESTKNLPSRREPRRIKSTEILPRTRPIDGDGHGRNPTL